jgi:hypothetical protein
LKIIIPQSFALAGDNFCHLLFDVVFLFIPMIFRSFLEVMQEKDCQEQPLEWISNMKSWSQDIFTLYATSCVCRKFQRIDKSISKKNI